MANVNSRTGSYGLLGLASSPTAVVTAHLLLFVIVFPFRIPVGSASIALTWVVIVVLLYFYFIKEAHRRFTGLPSLKLLTPFFIFTAFAAISIAAAPDKVLCIKKLILWCLGIGLMVLTRDITSSLKDRSVFMRLLFLSSLLVGCIGFMIIALGLIFGVEPVFDFLIMKIMPLFRSADEWELMVYKSKYSHRYLNWTVLGNTMFRNISIFLGPIAPAAFFGLLAPIALALYLNTRRNIYFFIFFFIFVNILLNITRGSWMPLLFALVFVYITSKGATKKILGALVIITIVVVVLSFEPYSARVFEKSFGENTSLSTRIEFLMRGLEIVKGNILFGVGFANYEQVVYSLIHEYPHNQYVELWAETGLGGLFGYLFILYTVIKRTYSRISLASTDYDRAIYIGLTGSVAFFAIYSFFEDLLATPPAILTFMLLVGASEGLARPRKQLPQ